MTIDTLCAERLGYMGYDVAAPNLDRLASEGAIFTQAITSESAWDRCLLSQVSAIEGKNDEAYCWLEEAVASWVNYRWSLRDPLLAGLPGIRDFSN